MKKQIFHSAVLTLIVILLSASAQAAKDPELFVGRSVEPLLSQWGKPLYKSVTAGGDNELGYIDVEILDANGSVTKKLNRRINEEDIPPGGTVRKCKTMFTVHRNGLVLSSYQEGGLCKSATDDAAALPDPISNDMKSTPGWLRYDGPQGMNLVELQAQYAFLYYDNYDKLDALYSKLADTKVQLNDGRYMLAGLESGLTRLFKAYKTWNKYYDMLKAWREKSPQSAAAAITEALYLEAYAWDARGTGPASSVTPEGWQLFRERLKKAEDVLQSSQAYASNNPLWYTAYMAVALGQNWPRDKMFALFENAKAKYPYYHAYYFWIITALLPKWGGSYEQVDNFIRSQISDLNPTDSSIMYTRMYWYVHQSSYDGNFNLFRDSLASWDSMKKGFSLLTEQHPISFWILNNYAKFACVASDKQTYQKLRPLIEGYIILDAWPENLSVDVCDLHLLTRT